MSDFCHDTGFGMLWCYDTIATGVTISDSMRFPARSFYDNIMHAHDHIYSKIDFWRRTTHPTQRTRHSTYHHTLSPNAFTKKYVTLDESIPAWCHMANAIHHTIRHTTSQIESMHIAQRYSVRCQVRCHSTAIAIPLARSMRGV
jgi:hypothetical protein